MSKFPGHLDPEASARLFDHVLRVRLGNRMGVARVEQIVDGRGDFQIGRELLAEESHVREHRAVFATAAVRDDPTGVLQFHSREEFVLIQRRDDAGLGPLRKAPRWPIRSARPR